MSPAVFKTDTTAAQAVGWVRFPDAPATTRRSPAGARIRRVLGTGLTALGLLFAVRDAGAQEPDRPPVPQDTIQAQAAGEEEVTGEDQAIGEGEEAAGEGAAGEQEEPQGRQPVNPTGALLRSIILPGWGQTAAGQPARGAIYFSVWSGGVFMILKTNAEANAAERGEDEDLIESRKQAREDWILFTGLWALLSGVDAWVSAQFAGFEGEVRPPQDGSPGVEFSYPVKLF